MTWVFRSGCKFSDQSQSKTYYDDIKQYYIETVKQSYTREINAFCYCAKAKIARNDRPKNSK